MTILASSELIRERNRIVEKLPTFYNENKELYLLDYEEVVDAHFCIADFFLDEQYGIGGIGPKDIGSLVSTVERQWTGFGGVTIYNTEYERVASLIYGIIKNHPFYDANKRTAFLCGLLQLHKMGRTITVNQKEFEDLMVAIADNSIENRSAIKDLIRKRKSHPVIRFLGRYLEKNSRKNVRLNKTLKFRQLRALIRKHGFDFDNQFKGSIDIIKKEEVLIKRFFGGDRLEIQQKTLGNIAYHGEGADLPDNTIRLVRQICGLTDQDGFDSEVLFRNAQPTFQLIDSYRVSLQRLAFR